MSLPQTHVEHTVAEYLALEREAEERHEFLDGQIFAMAGESPEHGAICINLSRIISTSLLGTPCQAFSKNVKVRSGPIPKTRRATKGLYSYPDLLVVCGELKFHDKHRDVLLNPSVVIEVLSPTTEGFDRGEKWLRYQMWLPELSDFLLVSQANPLVEHYHRRKGGEWIYTPVRGPEKSVHLYSVDCTLRLAEVYDRVVFPVDEESEAEESEA